jgi:hypothetical protein
MKDIVITGAVIRRELWWLLAAFILANLMNAYAIVVYDTEWKELFSTLGYVVALSIVLYVFIALLRLAVRGVRGLMSRKETA